MNDKQEVTPEKLIYIIGMKQVTIEMQSETIIKLSNEVKELKKVIEELKQTEILDKQ